MRKRLRKKKAKSRAQIERAVRRMNQPRYSRFGECNNCGDCCEKEGISGGRCEYLDRTSEDYAVCRIYGQEDRPGKCLLFPEAPEVFKSFPRCSYGFFDRWVGGQRIVADNFIPLEEVSDGS
jgi:hypothetical protein